MISPELSKFILEHENEDELKLLLKHKTILGMPATWVANQIAARRKAKSKLPAFYHNLQIVYPPAQNLEQCSSEVTALFKCEVLQSDNFVQPLKSLVDLTGGFGVDSFYFSRILKNVQYVEPDESLYEIALHNHKVLGADFHHHRSNAETFLNNHLNQSEICYLDPSRRDFQSRKVVQLKDCCPDITLMQSEIFRTSRYILLKASPLLDIHQAMTQLQHVRSVYVVSVNNECKELLFLADQNFAGEGKINAINLEPSKTIRFSFLYSKEKNCMVSYAEPATFLYEPNSSLMKAGAFKLIAQKYKLKKIHPNTHYYTSSELCPDFPGRIFQIEKIDPTEKEIKLSLENSKVNVTTRNYPETTEKLKRRFNLKDGGNKYLIGFKGLKSNHIVIANRFK